MNRSQLCPDPARLRRLAEGALASAEQEELTHHLDACPECQRGLEEVAAGRPAWARAVRHVDRDRLAPDSAFWPAVRQLEHEIDRGDATLAEGEVSEKIALDFLGPPEAEGSIGRLDRFDVVEVIGRGGMGIVLKARDACLERFVAVKLMDPKLADNPTARQRFCREARAAARVTHEHVVGVHTVEESKGGAPFLVMHYVDGVSLEQHLARNGKLPVAEVVRIGMQAAYGLAAAHAEGLIHRDVKPANILLEKGRLTVKITDFGLARAAEDVRLTQSGLVAGTPVYMAPEQARGEELDARTDLFSLGSVLYTLCTGVVPFDGNTPFLVLRRITDEAPRPIQELSPDAPDWLVEIIDRLMAKDPADRYQSASEVAEVLAARWTALQAATAASAPAAPARRTHRAVPARRPAGRAWVWPAVAVASWLLLPAFVVSEAAGWTHVVDAAAVGLHLRKTGDDSPQALAVFPGNAGPVWSIAISPDGDELAMALDDGTIKLWDMADGKVRETLNGHRAPVWSVRFSPDGKTLATASDDMTVRLWDLTGHKDPIEIKYDRSIRSLAFSPDGKTLATGSRDGMVRFLDIDTGQERFTFKAHSGILMSLVFSLDGKTLVTGGGDKLVKLWDADTGRERVTLSGHTGAVYAVALAPDGRTVASGGWDHTVRLWDADSGDQRAVLEGHNQDVWGVAFSPDGRTLASASEDRTVRLWDVATGRELTTFTRHTSTVYAVVFTPDGKTLASGGRDGTVRLWDVSAFMGP